MRYADLEVQDQIAVIWLDQEGEKVNKISVDLVEVFHELLDDLEARDDVKGIVVISRKKDNFIAGADLEKFLQITEPGQAADVSRKGHEVLNRIEKFPKPIVAAIHGAALGGGCEVALACHYRIATEDPKTVLGQPEVKLGLLPAGGGTQRLPRLVGIQRALEIMLTGKNIYPRQAYKMGLVDALIHPYGLLQAARTAARELAEKPFKRKTKIPRTMKLTEAVPAARKLIYKKARERVQKQTLGNYPAPLKIIDCVEIGMEQGIEAGYAAEAEKFDELMLTPQCKELIRLFFAMTGKKKNPLADQAREVKCIGVLGAGLMGSGIADVSIQQGYDVLMKDVSQEALGRGEKTIWQELDRKVRKRILLPFERDRIFSRLTGVVDYHGFEKADLVIEAVFEDLELKHKVLQEVEAVVPEHCIVASNTSSLPISEIASVSKRPEQVVGMHYFSPVPKMPLLEIIVTEKTAEWVTATAFEVGRRQGKTCIVVKDGPGFYTTRILAPLLNETLVLLSEGAAVEAIDRAMKQFGFPVGPVTLLDEVGIDVGAHVTRVMADFFAKRGVEPNPVIQQLYDAGYYGKKNKKGFYRYDSNGRSWLGRRRKHKEVNLGIYRFFGGPSRKPFGAEVIQQRLSLVMINEAVLCLQEGILQSPEDGDLGAVLGLGFPPFRGGPFRYVDSIGAGQIVEWLKRYEQRYGARYTPAGLLKEYAQKQKAFYEAS